MSNDFIHTDPTGRVVYNTTTGETELDGEYIFGMYKKQDRVANYVGEQAKRIAELEAEIGKLKHHLNDTVQKMVKSQSSNEKLEAEIERLKYKLTNHSQRMTQYRERIETLEKEVAEQDHLLDIPKGG